MDFWIAKLQFIPIALLGVALWVGSVYFVAWTTNCWFGKDIWPAIKGDPRAAADFHRFKLLSLALIVAASMLAGVIAP